MKQTKPVFSAVSRPTPTPDKALVEAVVSGYCYKPTDNIDKASLSLQNQALVEAVLLVFPWVLSKAH